MKKSLLLPIVILLVLLPLAYPIQITNDPKSTFKYDSALGTAEVTINFKSTLSNENGLFELQLVKNSLLQSVFFGTQAPCNPSTPWSQHLSYQTTSLGDTGSVTIKTTNIPDGSWTPTLIHYNSCCINNPNCGAIVDTGNVIPPNGLVLSSAITFQKTSSFCVQDVKTCPDGSTVSRDANNNCEFKACPTETDFRLSGLKRINNFEQFNALDRIWISLTNSPVYSVTLTNTGTQSAKGTIEAYYVSKENNPFFSNKLNELQTRNSLFPLQSALLVKSGKTCKGDIGASYEFNTLLPSESITLYLQPTKPSSCSVNPATCKLDGNVNYNANDEYLLVVNVVDSCTIGNSYDELGGCFNFGSSQCSKIPVVSGNDTVIDEYSRQSTIDRKQIQSTTSKDLIKSACATSDICKSDATCEPVQSLIENGYITETKAKDDIKTQKRILADATGGTAGAISAAFLGSTGGLALCGAFSAGTLGFGMPICYGVLTLGGAVVGGTLGDAFYKVFLSRDKEDLNEAGYCVPIDDSTSGNFERFVSRLGKGVNDAFGGKSKTSLDNTTMGYIILAVVAIFIIILLTRK